MLKVLSGTQAIRVFMADETDGFTGLTGLSLTVYLCKPNESSFTDVTSATTETELGNGWYQIGPTATHRNTAGENVWHIEASGAIPADVKELVGANWVWDAPSSQHSSAGTLGQDVEDILTVVQENNTTLSVLDGKVDVVDGIVDAIVADTNELQTDWANGGRLDAILDELTTQGDTNETKIDTIDANVDAVLVDTGTTIPGLIAALNNISTADVAAQLVAYDAPTKAELDAGLAALNDVSTADLSAALATYDGPTNAEMTAAFAALNNLSAAEVNAEVDSALADYDGPTNAEMTAAFTEIKGVTWSSGTDTLEAIRDQQTTIEGKIDVVDGIVDTILIDTSTTLPSQIFSLNDLSSADIDTALAAYDGPTKAELDAGLAALNDPTAAAIADAVLDELLSGHTTAGSLGKAIADILEDSGTSIPGLIAALNNISAAEVNAQVDSALADYDGPTKAELDAGFAALNDPTAAAIADAVLDESLSGHATAGTVGKAISDTLADTNELQTDDVPGLIAALNNVSTSDLASALATYDGPTNAEMVAAFTEIKGATWDSGTDTLEGIRDTALGSGGATASEIADAVLEEVVAEHSGVSGSLAAVISGIATIFSGITSLASWIGVLAGKSADASTLAEIQSTSGGASYDNTTDSQEAILDRGNTAWSGNASVTVTPYSATSPTRVRGTDIFLFVAETIPTAVTIYDANEVEVDLSGKTLVLTIDLDGVQVQSVTPTVSGSGNEVINFTPDAAVTIREQSLDWSLRDTANSNEVVAYGKIIVSEAPLED